MNRIKKQYGKESRCLVIVDDETAILTILEWMFKDEGYTVYTFTRAASALAFVEKNPVHMVISDYQMPDMDGLELAQRLQVSGWKGSFCLLSGRASALKNHPLTEIGVHQLFQKPFDALVLADFVRQALEEIKC